MSAASELVMRCFNARTVAHILHLQTRSFAAHKALNEFYDEIVGLADDFAEAYQGKYGLMMDYPTGPAYSTTKNYNDGINLVSELCDWITANRKGIGEAKDSELQNIIDEIVALCDSTLYKLKFLK